MTTSPDEPSETQDQHDPRDPKDPKPKDEDTAPEYIDDSQLPEDLRPTDDNPLAQNEDE